MRGNFTVDALETRVLFSTVLTVFNTNDSGGGSLRQAIMDANAAPAAQSATILFDISGAGVQTIKPLSQLPTITAEVDIEGTTDAAGDPLIELDGESAGDASGLVLNRSTPGNTKPSIVSGLIINRFSQFGIDIDGDPSTDVYGCRIGTDSTGAKAMGNGIGVELDSPGNQIGMPGSGPAFATIVSGNVGDGIDIENINNIVQNCFIGTDAGGNNALGNGTNGIDCSDGQNLIGGDRGGEGNVISGNLQDGINLHRSNVQPQISDNLIVRNKIGTNAAGTAAIGNQGDGILVSNIGGDDNDIGDDADADANLISGNVGNGINLSSSSNIQVQDNRIGSEADGTTSLGNHLDGVHLENSTSNLIYRNLIQGSGHVGVRMVDSSDNTVQAGNIVASHSDGVLIVQSVGTASGNTIFETAIGEGPTGLSLPNGGNGVNIVGASNNEINSNLLNNRLAGLEINGSTAVGNDFDGGSAYNNGKLGISIGDNIGTDHPNHQVNTGGGAGAGGPMLPDDGLNHPLISSASFDGKQTTITGTYLGDGGSGVSVEVYESDGADPSGFGEGEDFVDSIDVTVPSNGNASFTLDGEHSPRYGANTVYSAIVRRETGSGGTDISEFSNAVKVVGATISGTVFNDANGNGKQDTGEKGLAKQLVFVDTKGTGIFDDDLDPFATTNSNGNFTLFGPPSGAIHLNLMVASGFTQTLPNAKRPFYKLTIAPLSHTGGIVFGEEKIKATSSVVTAPLAASATSMFDVDSDDRKTILDDL